MRKLFIFAAIALRPAQRRRSQPRLPQQADLEIM